jgi:hypothetical protein
MRQSVLGVGVAGLISILALGCQDATVATNPSNGSDTPRIQQPLSTSEVVPYRIMPSKQKTVRYPYEYGLNLAKVEISAK